MKRTLPLLSTLLVMLLSFSLNAHNSDDAVLGIKSSHISADKAAKLNLPYSYGSRINNVYPASAAFAAGLQPLDYIYRIDDQTVSKQVSISDILEKYQPGDAVKVYYIREGAQKLAELTLNRRGDLNNRHTPSNEDPFLGVSLQHDNRSQEVEGVRVNIVHNSTAEAMGLKDGDIITAIDDYPVFDWHDTNPTINNRKVGDPIKVSYYRDGAVRKAERPIKSRAATHNGHSRPNGPNIIMPDEDMQAEREAAEVVLEVPEAEEASMLPEGPEAEEGMVLTGLEVQKLNIFPNPSTGIFDIQFTLSSEGETSINIYNPSGQAVYFNNLGQFTGTFSDRIDIANGVRGIYFLQIRQGNNLLTRKVVLQ